MWHGPRPGAKRQEPAQQDHLKMGQTIQSSLVSIHLSECSNSDSVHRDQLRGQ
jgi:hypothetical protein